MSYTAALETIAGMLFCAVPGFLLVKSRLIKENAIACFAKLLLFVCQPALIISTMTGFEFSFSIAKDLIFAFFVFLLSMLLMIGVMLVILRKKTDDAKFRIYVIASCMGNVSFMGVPMVRALLPDFPQAVAYTAMASLALNIIGWTVGSAVITRDKKYISPKKIFLNPSTLAIAVSIPLAVTNTVIPGKIGEMVTLFGRFATPLCMIILGGRLATAKLRDVFLQPGNYISVVVKQIIYPAAVLGILLLSGLKYETVAVIFIILCSPVATMVLNFSELLGEGQKEAASVVLLSTVFSVVTMPLMVLLI